MFEEIKEAKAKSHTKQARSSPLESRELWDLMNEKPGELLYAGEFDSVSS